MSGTLKKNIIKGEKETLFQLEGDMDLNGSRELKAELDSLLEEFADDMTIILDLEKVSYVASDGLGFLISLQKELNQVGIGLKIKNPQTVVRDLFSVTRIDRVIPVIFD